MRAILTILALALTWLCTAPSAHAQAPYPNRIVKIIVGFPAGSSIDIVARIYAQKLSEKFGQQFIVESRPGAAANIAAEAVVRSEPDGYTLYIGTVSNTVGTSLLKNLKFNFAEDIAPIAQIAVTSMVLVVDPSLGVSTVDEFVALAKKKPGEIFYASSGIGSAPHMAGELFNLMTQAKLVHAPYKAIPPALMDLLGNRIASVFATSPTAAPYIADGRLKGLAVTTTQRTKPIPQVPTMEEAGLKGYDSSIWFGFFAAKGTPQPIVTALANALADINKMPDVVANLANNGAEPLTRPTEEFGAYVRAEAKKWKEVIETAKITAE